MTESGEMTMVLLSGENDLEALHERIASVAADMRSAVLFDIDGVLADSQHRWHLVEEEGWDPFFEQCGKDPLLPLAHLIASLSMTYRIVLVTGRPERNRGLTMGWLNAHFIHCDELCMRPDNDFRTGEKRWALERLKEKYHIVCSFEDDPRNVAVYRELGIPVVCVYSGSFPGLYEDLCLRPDVTPDTAVRIEGLPDVPVGGS